MTDLLIGRQPIFNIRLDVIGYELLYRSGMMDSAKIFDGDLATTKVILNTFSEFGLDNLVGAEKAFINATRNYLVGKYPVPLPANRVVLEVLEDITVDAQLAESLKALAKLGFTIALDDVDAIEPIKPLLGIAKIVKLDMPKLKGDKLQQIVTALKKYNVQILAEKVETLDEFRHCKLLGMDLFQGYFLCKPNIVKKAQLDTSRLVIMRSLAFLQNPKTNFKELEQSIAQDVSLGYKVLKLVNSAHYSTVEPVKSLSQAIAFIGLNQIRAWMTLLMMASIENKPHELTTIAMQRAKMCDLLARASGVAQTETFFLVGLFSVLDAMMDLPMDQVIANLPVSKEVMDALLYHQGQQGEILKLTLAYERGNWDYVLKSKIDSGKVSDIYLETVKWVTTLNKSLYGSDNSTESPRSVKDGTGRGSTHIS